MFSFSKNFSDVIHPLVWFVVSTSAALDGLTSAAQNFLEKFTVQLRKNVDNEALNGPTGYQVRGYSCGIGL